MTKGIINHGYVSALDPFINEREINPNVISVNSEVGFASIMSLVGLKKPTLVPTYHHFIDEEFFKKAETTGATVSGSGTATITTTLTADTSGYIRKGDSVMFLASQRTGTVTTVTTTSGQDTIVIKSIAGTAITHVAGESLSIFSLAAGAQSAAPDNLQFKLTRISNQTQTFNETSSIDDVQQMNAITVAYKGAKYWTPQDHVDKKQRLEIAVDAQFLGGEMSVSKYSDTNPTLVDPNTSSTGGGGGAMQFTRGLDSYIQAYGTRTSAATPGTIVLADINTHLNALTAKRCPTDLIVGGANSVLVAFSTFWKAMGSATIASARLEVNGKALDFNVETVKWGKYNMSYMPMEILDNPNIFAGSDIAKSAYYIPSSKKVKTKGGGMQPAIQVRYKPSTYKFGNELIGEKHSGALCPFAPSGLDARWDCVFTTTQGLEVNGAQFMSRQKVN